MALSSADLLIAATAERTGLIAATAERTGLTVLAADKDFGLIATITGQPVQTLTAA